MVEKQVEDYTVSVYIWPELRAERRVIQTGSPSFGLIVNLFSSATVSSLMESSANSKEK